MSSRVVRKRRASAIVLLTAGMVLVSSCASSETPVQIGIKRTAVDLAFKDEALPAKPPTVRVVVQDLVTDTALPVEMPEPVRRPAPIGPPVEICPSAPVDAVPEQAVSINITKPPEAGQYTYRTQGTISIASTIFNISLPMPPVLRREVQNVEEVAVTDALGRETADKAWQYDVVTTLGQTTITKTYQMRAASIVFMKQVIKSSAAERTLEPSPPVTIYEYGAEGNDWTSAGLDRATNTAVVFEGRIAKRELVDVCGTLVDSYQAESSEVFQGIGAPGQSPYSSQTQQDDPMTRDEDESDPNRYNFATHIGPLPVKEYFHYTEIVAIVTPDGDVVQASIEYQYEATMMSLEPGKGRGSLGF